MDKLMKTAGKFRS